MKKYKGVPRDLRNKILIRDKHTCQKCKSEDKTGTKLEIHHINPKFRDGKDKEKNLITLYNICHNYAPNNIKEFNEYMSSELDGMTETLIKAFKKVSNLKD